MPPYDVLMGILEIATRAASTCNRQPWRFRVRDDHLEIFLLRTKNFFLKLENNIWLELGTLLENLSAGAAAKGWRIDYRLFPRCGLDLPAATVEFIPDPSAVPCVSVEAVMRRCTNRGLYDETPLPPETMQAVLDCNDDPNIGIRIFDGKEKEVFAGILADLEGVRFGNYRLMRELLPFLRFDPQEIELHRDRLNMHAMGVTPLVATLFKIGQRYPRIRRALHLLGVSLGYARIEKRRYRKRLICSGALIVLTVRNREWGNYVGLGHVAQRILNVLSEQGIATELNVSGLYLVELLRENLEIYSRREQIRLRLYYYSFETFFSVPDERVTLFIRAGRADPPRYRSLRKHVRNVLLDEEGDTPDTPLLHPSFRYPEAFSRNIGWLNPVEQGRLRTARVAIAGLGGVGGVQTIACARLGIGAFTLADMDHFELKNFNRHYGAKMSTIGEAKTEHYRAEVLDINPEADVRMFPHGLTLRNIEEFIDGADLVIDGLEVREMELREALCDAAQRRGIHFITSAPLGFGTSTIIFAPGGMSFRRFFHLTPGMTNDVKVKAMMFGMCPRLYVLRYMDVQSVNLSVDSPSVGSTFFLIAGINATEAMKILTGKFRVRTAPWVTQFDCALGRYHHSYFPFGQRGPWRRLKRWLAIRVFSRSERKEPSFIGK